MLRIRANQDMTGKFQRYREETSPPSPRQTPSPGQTPPSPPGKHPPRADTPHPIACWDTHSTAPLRAGIHPPPRRGKKE